MSSRAVIWENVGTQRWPACCTLQMMKPFFSLWWVLGLHSFQSRVLVVHSPSGFDMADELLLCFRRGRALNPLSLRALGKQVILTSHLQRFRLSSSPGRQAPAGPDASRKVRHGWRQGVMRFWVRLVFGDAPFACSLAVLLVFPGKPTKQGVPAPKTDTHISNRLGIFQRLF